MGFSRQYKEAFLRDRPAKKMRYADRRYDLKEVSAAFTCGSCYEIYKTYSVFLQHLYWKHGTQSKDCSFCPVKKWEFARHKCFVMPNEDLICDDDEVTDICYDKEKNMKSDMVQYDYKEVVSTHYNHEVKSSIENNTLKTTIKTQKERDAILIEDLYVSDSEEEGEEPIKVKAIEITNIPETERESIFCFCGKNLPSSPMIGCDNRNCRYEWFHYHCVGIEIVPEGDWYCPQCAT